MESVGKRSPRQKRLKVLRSDNGGEYLSSEFRDYLSREGIRYELTIPKTPQQNGVAERMNRTLVESVRSMLIDAHLPHKVLGRSVINSCVFKK